MIDQLKLADSATIKLECAHTFLGGEMRCQKCGEYFTAAITPKIEMGSTLTFNDGLELFRTHDA